MTVISVLTRAVVPCTTSHTHVNQLCFAPLLTITTYACWIYCVVGGEQKTVYVEEDTRCGAR